MAETKKSAATSSGAASDYLVDLVWVGAVAYALFLFLSNAYIIRLQAIEEFGPVIHEFDPYFNWRATQYLYENGYKKFFTWFDHKVWYPLGRPVGTTIYPGMQFTAVFLKNTCLVRECPSMISVVTSPLGLVLWQQFWWGVLPMRRVCL